MCLEILWSSTKNSRLYSQICCIALRFCRLRMGFSVPSIIWVGAELMQITMQHTNKTENDSRLLKNSEGNRDDEWTFCRGQEADIALFLQEMRIRKIRTSSKKTSWLLPETGRSQATNLETQKQTKWIEMRQSQVIVCFLRGPLRWLMGQEKCKIPSKFAKRAAWYNEFGYKSPGNSWLICKLRVSRM